MSKYDFAKEMKTYYKAPTKPQLVELNKGKFLTILGKGEPAGDAFVSAVESLFPLAYGIKKICKSNDQDFGVPKLEGLWWVEDGKNALEINRSEWYWKLMIQMPHFATNEMYETAKVETFKKKKLDLINSIQYEEYDEGKVVQVTHIGPYSTEPETIAKLFAFMNDQGLSVSGLHHEIYISDPRKTEPEKMKTILRYPVC